MIKSPLNYTGNKFRILPQILPHFPRQANKMVDMFCGGATVGINCNSETVYFVDSNERVISLLKFLANTDIEKLISKLILLARKYNLSVSYLDGYSDCFSTKPSKNKNNGLKAFNKDGFYRLRYDYNCLSNKETAEANTMLYLLLVYGFNNDLRFNSKGEYNLPCGKTDLNRSNINKIRDFNKRAKERNFVFICGDFRDKKIQETVLSSNFVYLDPPYLITDAVYNETSKWDSETEKELISFWEILVNKKIPFVLSNVLDKNNGKILNTPLKKFIENNSDVEVYDIDYNYRSSSYNKKNRDANEREIIVCYGVNHD